MAEGQPAGDLLLGLDVGTTGVKVGLFTADGRALAQASVGYPLRAPEPGAAEQDVEEWWRAIGSAARSVLAGHDAGRLAAVAACGQGPTLVAADADLQPTGPAITWLDARDGPEAALLYGRLGQPVSIWGSWTTKALWLARHRPDAFARSRWLFTAWDYVASRLSRTVRGYPMVPPEEVAAAELDPGYLPPPVEAGRVVGPVHPRSAAETGIPAGVPVVAGMVDGPLGLLGSGARRPGQACLIGGTSGTLTVVCREPLGWPILDLRMVGAASNAYGKALDWFLARVAHDEGDYAAALARAGEVPPGADGLLFLPYLAGERAPHYDPRARASFVGLTLQHGRAHLLRAVLEGVALGFRQIAADLAAQGAEVDEVRVIGGAARSQLWNQIQADVLERPVLVPEVLEGTVLGAAMLAATGVGLHPDLGTAAERMVRVARRLDPDPRHRQLYADLAAVYADLYPALREISWRLGRPGSEG